MSSSLDAPAGGLPSNESWGSEDQTVWRSESSSWTCPPPPVVRASLAYRERSNYWLTYGFLCAVVRPRRFGPASDGPRWLGSALWRDAATDIGRF